MAEMKNEDLSKGAANAGKESEADGKANGELKEENGAREASSGKGKKKNLGMLSLVLILLLAAGGGLLWWRNLSISISTENAKVTGDIVDISFRLGGQLERILVQEGEQVKAGIILAELDPGQYRLALEQARAGLELAQANYARLPYDLQSLQIGVDKAAVGVNSAMAQVKSSEIAMQDAKRIVDKNEVLAAQGAISQEALESTRSRYHSTKLAWEGAQAGLQAAEANLKDSRQKLQAGSKTSPEVLLAQVKAAQAAYDLAQFNYDSTMIKAPGNGLVLRINAQAGENISPGQVVVSISELKNVWINANIEEKKISRVKVGQKVEVRIDAYPGRTLKGKVVAVGNAAQSTFAMISTENSSGNFTKVSQRLPVKISLDKEDLILKPGMSAFVKIYTNKL